MSRTSDAQTNGRTDHPAGRDSGVLRILSGLALVLGAWLVVSPFVLESTGTAMWNNVIVGLAVIVLAGFNYYRFMDEGRANVGVSALVALLGLWALIAPFVIDMGSNELLWGTAIGGLLIAVLSGYNAYANRQAPARTTRAEA